MKIYIKHRVNKIDELSGLDPSWGAEIDLRSNVLLPGSIHLSHDPWSLGDAFEEWVKTFAALEIRGPVILNTKEDGLEARATDLLKKHGISNYFFLDTALPTLVKYSIGSGASKFAIRISKHEPLESAAAFREKADWAWVDCFDGTPMSAENLEKLKDDFKICLVSPELQSQPVEKIAEFEKQFQLADAICTKSPQHWQKVFGAHS